MTKWFHYIPVVAWFFDQNTPFQDFDAVTYDFEFHGLEFYDGSYVSNPRYGYVGYSIGCSSSYKEKVWISKSIMEVLTTVGGQTIAILAIAQFLIQHYQDFAYIKSISKNLYYE